MTAIDPFDLLKVQNSLLNVIKIQGEQIETLSRRNVYAGSLGELSGSVGQVNLANNSGTITEFGFQLAGSVIDIGFWASIGVPSNLLTYIYALAVQGTSVIVGGDFVKIGGINANYIAKYETTTGVWSNIGSSTALNSVVNAIAVSGSDIYVGGAFTNCDGNANADYIAKWNGSAWSALGVGSINASVLEIAISGTDVYVGGDFTNCDGNANADYIAKWNGSAWSALGAASINNSVWAIAISGTDVYAGGLFTNCDGNANADYIAKWNGSAWSALGAASLNADVYAIAISGTDIYVGGVFTNCDGNANADYIAKWNGSAWSALGAASLSHQVRAIIIHGTNIYAGGMFISCDGNTNGRYIAKWDGAAWSALNTGLSGGNMCRALCFIDDDLFCGGNFTFADGRASKGIAAYISTLENIIRYLEVSSQALQDALLGQTGVYPYAALNGWNPANATWTYASASTFTVAGDWTATYKKGTRIKWTQTTVKYGVVASSSYSAPNTTVTILVNTDYTIANAAISANYYSYIDAPDFPKWFSYAPTVTGYSSVPTNAVYQYAANATDMTVIIREATNGTSNATTVSVSLPATASALANGYGCWAGFGVGIDNGATLAPLLRFDIAASGTVINAYPSIAGSLWTASGGKKIFSGNITYLW